MGCLWGKTEALAVVTLVEGNPNYAERETTLVEKPNYLPKIYTPDNNIYPPDNNIYHSNTKIESI
jgi:hypothetical protein